MEQAELLRESAAIEHETLARLARAEWDAVERDRHAWSVMHESRDLELVARVLACILDLEREDEISDEFAALAELQNPDGGFPRVSGRGESRAVPSAACALVLARGNRSLERPAIAASVCRAIDHLLATQQSDGRWVDPDGADVVATARVLELLIAVGTGDDAHHSCETHASRQAGLRFLLAAQSDDGGWYDGEFDRAGFELTSQVVEHALAPELLSAASVDVASACARGVARLALTQAPSGAWGEDDVQSTMGCVRACMLAARRIEREAPELRFIDRAVAWILACKNDAGWGDMPGAESNLPRTCDGIALLCKLRTSGFERAEAPLRLWVDGWRLP